MNLLNKLTRQSLLLNKRRTIVTIVGIMLSVALLTAVSTMFFCGRSSVIAYEKAADGDYHIAFNSVPVAEAERIAGMDIVEAVSQVQVVGYARLEQSKNADKPYAYVAAYDEVALERLGIQLMSGRLPENDTEVVIPYHLITNGRVKDIKVGDTITLSVGRRLGVNHQSKKEYVLDQSNPFLYEEEQFVNTGEKTYTVVGMAYRPNMSVEPYSAPGYTFITRYVAGNAEKDTQDNTQDNMQSPTVDLYVRLKAEKLSQLFDFAAEILELDPIVYKRFVTGDMFQSVEEFDSIARGMEKAKYRTYYNSYVVDLESHIFASDTIVWLGGVVMVVILIILTTSVYCIRNSFDISITEKIRQYGMLASIGATKKQIRRNVFYEAYVLGVIGILLGVFCGLFASFVLVKVGNFLLGDYLSQSFHLVFAVSWHALALSVVFSVLMIFLSSMGSARKAARITPIEAIRSNTQIKLKKRELKCPALIRKLFGVGGEISYKNLKRSRGKYRTTVISIIVSVSVFITMTALVNLLYQQTELEISGKDYNLRLYVNTKGNEGLEAFMEELAALPGIDRITLQRTVGMSGSDLKPSRDYFQFLKKDWEQGWESFVENFTADVNVTALGEKEFARFADSVGVKVEDGAPEGILINQIQVGIQNEKGVYSVIPLEETTCSVGDVVHMYWDRETENREFEVKICAVTDKIPFGIDANYQSRIVVSDAYFNEMFGWDDGYLYIGMDAMMDAEDPDVTQDMIEALFQSDETYWDFHYSLMNYEQDARETRSLLLLVSIFLYGFITVVTLIGVTSIFNTITTNMELRRREFAMLRSIGMTGKEFNRMIRLESVFLGTKALLFGVPAGMLLSYLLHVVMYRSMNEYLPGFKPPYSGILIAAAAVFVLIFCIMNYSMGKIKKQNTIETIRNENV